MSQEKLFRRIGKLKVPVADLADGCREVGFSGRVTDRSLRPAVPLSRFAGTAVTVREYLAHGKVDYSAQMARVYKLGRSVPKAVLVIGNEVPEFACMGSGGARVAMAHGFVGCVVAGVIRDTQELPEIGFPLFGTAVNPNSVLFDQAAPGKSIHFELGGTVSVAGIKISHGDIIVGDNDGLIALRPDQVEAVVLEAERIVQSEHRIFAFLKRGGTFEEFLKLNQTDAKPNTLSAAKTKRRRKLRR